MKLLKKIKKIFKKEKMQRTNLNPHKNEAAIKDALLKCKTDTGMDYDTFYNDINYISPGVHLSKYYDYCIKLLKNHESWLDVGCGSGNILKNAIADKNIKLYGMDVVNQSVENAINNGIDCIKNSAANRYPYDNCSFNLVTATDMLEHLHKNDVNPALKEIFRVLKSNHYALLAPATKPDLTGYFHLTVESKEWWVKQCEKIGFLFVEFVGVDGIVFKKN